EQGLGDAIQFARYGPLVAARGGRIILEVDGRLHALMTSLSGVTQVVARGDALPNFDWHCPLLSLPLAFGTELETIPSSASYLSAPPQKVTDWGRRLGAKSRPRVGIVWSGNRSHKRDRNRSIDLDVLLPILNSDVTFVSLQKDVRAGDAAVLEQR